MRTVVIGSKIYKVGDDNKILGEYVGPIFSPSEINVVAAEHILSFKPVVSSGVVADSNNVSHRAWVIGISISEVQSGFVGMVQFSGELMNTAWNWSIGEPIFINQKVLSNIAPTRLDSRWSQQIGVAIRPNTIVIDLKHSILL